jgi:hypothetical protein
MQNRILHSRLAQRAAEIPFALGLQPQPVDIAADPALHLPVGDPFSVKAGDVGFFDQRVVVDGIAVAVAILRQGGRRQQRGEQDGAHQWT